MLPGIGANRQALQRVWSRFGSQRRHLARGIRSVDRLGSAENRSTEQMISIRDESDFIAEKSENSTTTLDDHRNFDYLGIREETDFATIHGSYCYGRPNRSEHIEQLKMKYEPLLEASSRRRKSKEGAGKQMTTSFGMVRLDRDNVPRYHGEYERRLPGDDFDQSTNSVANIVRHISRFQIETLQKDENANDTEESNQIASEATKFEEKQKSLQLSPIEEIAPTSLTNDKAREIKSLTISKIDFRYSKDFQHSLRQFRRDSGSSTNASVNDWIEYEKRKRKNELVKGAPTPEEDPSTLDEREISERLTKVKLVYDNNAAENDQIEAPRVMSGDAYLREIYEGKRTAYFKNEYDDNLQQLRKNKHKLDSKGFRILKHQIPDYSAMSNDDIVDLLERQILYNAADIVAINKPYGISMYGSGSDTKSMAPTRSSGVTSINLHHFLPQLAARLKVAKLYTVHRLDRDTTGVLILATSQPKAKELNEMFVKHQIEKHYLAITKTVPEPARGVIDIPIERGYIKSPGPGSGTKRERMVLCPEPVAEIRARRRAAKSARAAITRYRVIASAGNAALLDVQPITGLRHQIRVHLGFGLRCPVLGDHKYSQVDALVPQRLPTDILTRLRVRQAKARDVPLHLHAYRCVIPQAGVNGRNVFLRAPLPYHFRANMASLKLRLDDR